MGAKAFLIDRVRLKASKTSRSRRSTWNKAMLSRFAIALRTVLLSLYLRGPGRSCYPVKFSVSRLHAALVFRFPDKPHEERIILQLLSDGVQKLRYGETLSGVGFD